MDHQVELTPHRFNQKKNKSAERKNEYLHGLKSAKFLTFRDLFEQLITCRFCLLKQLNDQTDFFCEEKSQKGPILSLFRQ